MLIINSHYHVDCHFSALFCLDYSRAPIHDVHRIPYSQRDASWVGIAIWISTFWPTTMLCSSFRVHLNSNLFKYRYKTIQVHYINQVWALKQLQLILYNIEASCLAHTLNLYHHGPYAPDKRSSSWFYSGVALGEEVCFGTAISWGQAVCVHLRHPYYANPLLGLYWTTSCSIAPYGLATMALASILFCRKMLPLHKLGS